MTNKTVVLINTHSHEEGINNAQEVLILISLKCQSLILKVPETIVCHINWHSY